MLFKGSLATTSLIEPTPNKGIIGLGGSSKHYDLIASLLANKSSMFLQHILIITFISITLEELPLHSIKR